MPVENETLTVRPVPVLTLNPRPKDTLEGRLGLSAPLIRRAILVNLDAVAMPDLALVGEAAVEVARAHPPLVLAAPAADGQAFHDAIIQLTRAILAPAAHPRVDVEIIVNLVTGMTAFIPSPRPAITYVMEALGILAETLGWARPGWSEAVTQFEQGRKTAATGTSAIARRMPSETQRDDGSTAAGPTTSVSLAVPPPPPRRRTSVPELDLSEELRARLIWFAMETQQDIDVALTTLLDFYLEWREANATIDTLAAILRLGAELERLEIDGDTVHAYLQTLEALQKEGCEFDDVPEALRLITRLQGLPFAWTWDQAEAAIRGVAVVLEAGITLEDVPTFLERHSQLEAIGFDEATAIAVIDALSRAGAVGNRRDAVLEAMVVGAGKQVDVQDLETQRQALEGELAELSAQAREDTERLEALQTEVAALEQEVSQLQAVKAQLEQESERQAGGLAVVEALQAFLLGKTAEAEALWTTLEGLFVWRRKGGRVDDSMGALFTNGVKQKMLTFFQQLIRDGLTK
jgi:hypothetical protein